MDAFGCDGSEWFGPLSPLTPAARYEYHQPNAKVMMPEPPASSGLDSTQELLVRVRQGDREALERLIARCLPALRRWARGRLPSAARGMLDTQDLVQETILSSLRHLDHFESRHEGALQAYLRQAVLNRLRDERRRKGRAPSMVELDDVRLEAAGSPLEEAIGREAVERYEAALARLKPEERELIIARVEMDYSYEELAEMFAKPTADAARKAAQRALVRLAEEMKPDPT
jgi:RNA polymerase sigma-70 factor (ECF subfamily)